MSLLIATVAVGGLVSGYIFTINSSEKAGLSLAATARAVERIEQTRAARWDILSYPVVDNELQPSNFPMQVVVLDLAGAGTNTTSATNFTSIFEVSSDPPLRGVRVDCVWSFRGLQTVTNSVETVRSPD